jgi:capsular exopolysaccharide synthesis family protein
MDDLKLKANQAQERLAELQKRRGLIGVDETDNIVTDKLKDLNQQLTAAESDRIIKEARYRIAGSGNPELIASTVPDATLQVLRSQQAELRVEYARLSTKFGEGYPKLSELGNQMAEVDKAINAELKNLSERYKNEYLTASNAEKMLQGKFDEQEQKAYDLNQGAAQYAILKHEVETTQDLYQTLQLKLKQAGIVAGLASANIGVVEAAQVPAEPIDPRPGLDLAIGLGCGGILGILSAIGLEALDSTVRNADEVEHVVQLPVLAEIPSVGRKTNLDDEVSQAELKLIALHRPQSLLAESYRSLRASLLHQGRAPQVLAVTSCLPSEGKTSTAINCAVVLAQQGARVLLIDADLRNPTVHEALGLARDPGLSGVLAGVSQSAEVIAIAQLLPNLAILTAGAPTTFPAEMLGSARMTSLVQNLRGSYDHIVLDTPPSLIFTDAVAMSGEVDAMLLVARCGSTTKFALRHLTDTMARAGVDVAGVVLTAVDQRYANSYYHRYGYSRSHPDAKLLSN